MQFLFDFLPIVAFFIAFKFWGIFTATAIAMAISLAQVLIHWIRHRRFQSMQIINLVIIIVFGGSTLLMHNELFIKWKPTVLNWALALIFAGSQLFTEKPVIQRLLEPNINLPKAVWSNLNIAWCIFFSLMGAINLFVAYNFNTNTWVNFKLFGILGMTFLFAILQSVYLAKYIKEKPE